MNKIEIKQGNIIKSKYEGYNSYNHDQPPVPFSYIEESDLKNFREFILTLNLVKFDEKDTVYFTDSVTFSRAKFRELFPNTKIVYNPAKATAIIVDKDALTLKYNKFNYPYRVYCAKPRESVDDLYVNNIDSPFKEVGMLNYFTIHETNVKSYYFTSEEVDKMNFFIDGTKKFVDVNTIQLKSDLVIDDDTFDKLNKLLASEQPQNIQLASVMLAGFDYELSKGRIAALLKLNWDAWENYDQKKVHITLRTTLIRLFNEYPLLPGVKNAYQKLDDRNNCCKFWLDLYKRHSDDALLSKYFQKWLMEDFQLPEGDIVLEIKFPTLNAISAVSLTDVNVDPVLTYAESAQLADTVEVLETINEEYIQEQLNFEWVND
jgi:hypothetical protein